MPENDDLLEKIDTLRARGGLSYRQASELLEEAGGDLLKALILLEEKQQSWQERFQVRGAELVQRVRELIREGNISRIIVKQNGNTLIEIPVTVGALGAVFLPTLAALAVIAALVTRCAIVVERREPKPNGGSSGAPEDSAASSGQGNEGEAGEGIETEAESTLDPAGEDDRPAGG